MKLTLAFLGTPDFAATLLQQIAQDTALNIKFVFTQPDKKVGRKQTLTESPVKKTAKHLRLPVYDGDLDAVDFKSVDIALVFAYGKIIPANFLQQPRFGFWNIHPSLLPKFRGPSPIAYSLIFGEKKTGVTLIKLDEKMDHGPIIIQREMDIMPMDTRMDLEMKLTDFGAATFRREVWDLTQDMESFVQIPQDHSKATYTRLLTKEDGFIPYEILQEALKGDVNTTYSHPLLPHLQPESIFNLYRGLYPWPGIWTKLPDGKRLKITNMSYADNRLMINKVQLEGKNEVDFQTFQKAYHLF